MPTRHSATVEETGERLAYTRDEPLKATIEVCVLGSDLSVPITNHRFAHLVRALFEKETDEVLGTLSQLGQALGGELGSATEAAHVEWNNEPLGPAPEWKMRGVQLTVVGTTFEGRVNAHINDPTASDRAVLDACLEQLETLFSGALRDKYEHLLRDLEIMKTGS